MKSLKLQTEVTASESTEGEDLQYEQTDQTDNFSSRESDSDEDVDDAFSGLSMIFKSTLGGCRDLLNECPRKNFPIVSD